MRILLLMLLESPGSIVQLMKSLLWFWGAKFILPFDMEGLEKLAFEQMVKPLSLGGRKRLSSQTL